MQFYRHAAGAILGGSQSKNEFLCRNDIKSFGRSIKNSISVEKGEVLMVAEFGDLYCVKWK